MECSFCNRKIPKLFSHKNESFSICNDCLSKLPFYFSKRISEYTYEEISTILNWESEKKNSLKQIFFTTSSYGNLHIDSIHHLFAIGETNDFEKGKPVSNDVIIVEIERLQNISFDVKVDRSSIDEVKGSITMSCIINNPDITIQNILIKKNESITPTMVENNSVIFSLPPEVQLIWNEILEIREQLDKHSFLLSGNQREIDMAMGLYMVKDGFTLEQLKKQRNILMKAFHPDVDTSAGADERSQIVINAFNLLKQYAE